jgi:hypothetical protein
VAKKKRLVIQQLTRDRARDVVAHIYIYKSRHDLTTESAETGVVATLARAEKLMGSKPSVACCPW